MNVMISAITFDFEVLFFVILVINYQASADDLNMYNNVPIIFFSSRMGAPDNNKHSHQ